jgi:hypothetical protein
VLQVHQGPPGWRLAVVASPALLGVYTDIQHLLDQSGHSAPGPQARWRAWVGTAFDLSQITMPEPGGERADLVAPLAELDAVLRRCDLARPLRRLLLGASGVGEDYLCVFADYAQLVGLRDAASRAANDASGDDRRVLDRFTGRADGLATTLSGFLEADENMGELLN